MHEHNYKHEHKHEHKNEQRRTHKHNHTHKHKHKHKHVTGACACSMIAMNTIRSCFVSRPKLSPFPKLHKHLVMKAMENSRPWR